ncbi:hypothetical protein K523DRAFT_142714 [Schizophyllum commune Tattone D]|nr:hypothetical protein K523DRAFT_142714 [Schizophyllum commune Tattone D]
MIVTTCPMLIGHLVATIPTIYKTMTTTDCCNVCCNKSLQRQLVYWPVGHCRAGRHRHHRRRDPAAAVRDAIVVATLAAPRRAPHVHPAAPSDLSHALPAPRRLDTRARRVPTIRSLRHRTPCPALAVARAPANSPPALSLPLSANAENAPTTDRGPRSGRAPAPLLLPRVPAVELRASGYSRVRAHARRIAPPPLPRPQDVARARSSDRDGPHRVDAHATRSR